MNTSHRASTTWSAHPPPSRELANRRRWVRCNTRTRACTSRQFQLRYSARIGKNDQVIAALIVSNIGSTSLVVVKSTALRIARSAIQMRNTEHRTPTGGVHQPTLMLESHRVPDTSPTSAAHEQNSGGATRPWPKIWAGSPAGESTFATGRERLFSRSTDAI